MEQPALDRHTAAHVAELFRAFSDTGRVRILSALLAGEANVAALAGQLQVSESAVSHHLRGLRQMRLVRARREGKRVFYRIEDEHVTVLLQQGIRHGAERRLIRPSADLPAAGDRRTTE